MNATHALLLVAAALQVGCASAPPGARAPEEVEERAPRTLLAAVRTDDGVYHLKLTGRRGLVHLPVDPASVAPIGTMVLEPLPAGTPVEVQRVQRAHEPLGGLDGPARLVVGVDAEVYLAGDGRLTRLLALPLDEPGPRARGARRDVADRAPDGSSLAGGVFQAIGGLSVVVEGVGLLISLPFMMLTIFLLV